MHTHIRFYDTETCPFNFTHISDFLYMLMAARLLVIETSTFMYDVSGQSYAYGVHSGHKTPNLAHAPMYVYVHT